MRKKLFKSVLLIVSFLILVSVSCIPVYAVNIEDKIVLKKSDTEYLIYYKDILNQEFEFAFSSNKEANEADLTFTKSAKDTSSNVSNIAYVDETFLSNYFNGSKQAYIWIKNNNDEIVVKSDLINLSNALDEQMLDLANTTTRRINTNTDSKSLTKEVINGVETIVTKGKITIIPKSNAKYQFVILKANDESSNARKLYNLAEQLKNNTDTYQKIKLSKEFYDLYISLIPQNTDWKTVNNLEILQPDEAQQGDRYVVYLKEEVNGQTTIDAKFLTSGRSENQGKNQVEEKFVETVKLPVTFDNGIILFVILAIATLALIIFILMRKKLNKEENK